MTFDTEQLKLLAAALALVISTATVQFNIASFVNKVRDEFHDKRIGGWCRFSEYYDLLWGYFLGIAFNVVFFIVADIMQRQTSSSPYSAFGSFLWWMYLVNLIAWIVGMIIDFLRVQCWPAKKPTRPAEKPTTTTTTTTTTTQ